ncbi:MAG TPA: metallophosphoesterase [Nitrososphaeraceae archaeon]|nr:metallophosphoesterase [Nitrososphaeraceae archaeon]
MQKVNVNRPKISMLMFNNGSDFSDKFRISNHIILISTISVISFLMLFGYYNITAMAQESLSQLQNKALNIVAVGDFYCNDETEDTIKKIISINPEMIITTGDHVKDVKSIKCWAEISEPIKNKLKIAIGNHDVESKKIYKQLVKYHNLTNPYYSHDFRNIHFISLSTEHPFEEGSQQYEFIKNDLEKVSKNQNIDWIIVHSHKPLYSTRNTPEISEDLRNIYQPLFEKYDVDLVISSHNHYYERTYPLSYNNDDDQEPIINDDSESNYLNTDGIIFLTVGTGGDEMQEILDKEDYYVIQNNNEFGFINLKLENNGKTLVGEFRTGEDEDNIIDSFNLTKS